MKEGIPLALWLTSPGVLMKAKSTLKAGGAGAFLVVGSKHFA